MKKDTKQGKKGKKIDKKKGKQDMFDTPQTHLQYITTNWLPHSQTQLNIYLKTGLFQ